MLALRDCIDMCDLTEQEVAAIAEEENLPPIVAVMVGCSLLRSQRGLERMRGIAAAIALHVQACFSAERAHHNAIAAASETELMAYDINTGWPA